MTSEWAGEAVRGVRTLFQGVNAGLSDSELLRRFTTRDEASASAFELLVARHGPAVWGVCRRTLADPADALDAFQAIFLILVQKAPTVRVDVSLGPWLHGVSIRVARRARANVARRRAREQTNAESLDRVATSADPIDDLRAVLDHELARLPTRYRLPLILCYLEGLTHEEAATRLACPVGTVRSRLARGRGLLQSRLVRKGFAPSAVATALAFEAKPAFAGFSAAIVAATVKLALGQSPAGAVPLALVAGFGRSLLLAKLGRVAVVVAILCVTVGIAFRLMPGPTREADDAPLPLVTVEQLAARIEEASQAYSRGIVETEYEEESMDLFGPREFRPRRIRPPGDDPDPTSRKPVVNPPRPKYEKAPGRSRHASDGRRWKASLDTVMTFWPKNGDGTPSRRDWIAGFDGTIHYNGDGEMRSVYLGSSQDEANQYAAPFLFWRRDGRDLLLNKVLVPDAEITQKTVDGFRCYVVRTKDAIDTTREVVISARQSYLPLSLTEVDDGKVKLAAKLLDLRKLPGGRWYPGRLMVEEWFESEAAGFILQSRRESRVVKFDPDPVFKDDDFAPSISWNARVLDYRVGQVYRNDPWWPEIRDYLAREFAWPWSDLTPLAGLMSPDPALEGRDAPPLSAAEWLSGEPVSWDKLRGKVVLLVFSKPGDVAVLPALQRLRQAYGKDGFEVVEVLPSTTTANWAADYLAEYRVDHPVFLDRPSEGQQGLTFAAYGAGRPFIPQPIDLEKRVQVPDPLEAYLIDSKGKVHAIPKGDWSKALVEQLRLAGSKTANPLPITDELGPGSRFRQLRTAWEGWVKTAPATARFVGNVVDAVGKPVAGAKVQARLYANVSRSWVSLLSMTAPELKETTSGPDGSFVFDRLCKGNYVFTFTAKGLATSVRNPVIGPALGDVDLKLVLAQGDTVSGVVLDAGGRPVAGARAELFGRMVDGEAGTTLQTFELAKSAVADANGRFRFEGLWAGRYSLRVSADGLSSQTRENVPAGAADLEFRLNQNPPEK